MKRYSIMNNLDKCFFCGKPAECIHEVYFGTAIGEFQLRMDSAWVYVTKSIICQLGQYITIEQWI